MANTLMMFFEYSVNEPTNSFIILGLVFILWQVVCLDN